MSTPLASSTRSDDRGFIPARRLRTRDIVDAARSRFKSARLARQLAQLAHTIGDLEPAAVPHQAGLATRDRRRTPPQLRSGALASASLDVGTTLAPSVASMPVPSTPSSVTIDFAALYRTDHRKIFALAWSLLLHEQDALDVVQETFTRAIRAAPRFEGRSEPSSWLFRIATNICLDRRRARGRRRELALDSETLGDHDGPQAAVRGPGEALAAKELGHAMARGLDCLRDDQRSLLLMRAVDGLSYRELARQHACPIGTVMSRLFNARRLMRERLAPLALAGRTTRRCHPPRVHLRVVNPSATASRPSTPEQLTIGSACCATANAQSGFAVPPSATVCDPSG